jgi:dienelactone hydrolase
MSPARKEVISMIKTVSLMIFSLIALVLAAFAFGAQEPARLEDALTAKARAFLSDLQKGDFVLAEKDFDPTMSKALGPDKLEALWTKQLPAQVGAFKTQGPARREEMQGYQIVLVTCEFEKATLDARVAFDKDGRIAGLFFVPPAPAVKYEPPAYADPSKFTETEVTVGSGEWALPGTLTMPKGPGPFPGVVLVHGSGPNDRDESIGPNRPFQDIAWGLATRGIAVLRYDKRSKVYGQRIVADPKLEATMTVKDETIDDALTAAALLEKTKGIDPKRVFILGHSLGGYLMPRIALAARPLHIAGFIIMAGLTRPLDDTILRQMEYIYGLAGPNISEEDKKKLAEIKADVAKIKALTEADRGSTVKILGAMPAYWLDLRGYDPPEVAESVHKPILILQGGHDYQVTTEDFDNWKKALGGRKDVEFRLYPDLNHLFYESPGMATPLDYMQRHGSVAPVVIDDIAHWIDEH